MATLTAVNGEVGADVKDERAAQVRNDASVDAAVTVMAGSGEEDALPRDALDSDDSDFDTVSTDWSDSTESSDDVGDNSGCAAESGDLAADQQRVDVELSPEFLDLIDPHTEGMRLADGTACEPALVISALDVEGTHARKLSAALKLVGDPDSVFEHVKPEIVQLHAAIRRAVAEGLFALATMARACRQRDSAKVSLRRIIAADMLTPRAAAALRHLRGMNRSRDFDVRQVYWAMGHWVRTDAQFGSELAKLLPRTSKDKYQPTVDISLPKLSRSKKTGRFRVPVRSVTAVRMARSLMESLMAPATAQLVRDAWLSINKAPDVSVALVRVDEGPCNPPTARLGVIVGPLAFTTNDAGDAVASYAKVGSAVKVSQLSSPPSASTASSSELATAAASDVLPAASRSEPTGAVATAQRMMAHDGKAQTDGRAAIQSSGDSIFSSAPSTSTTSSFVSFSTTQLAGYFSDRLLGFQLRVLLAKWACRDELKRTPREFVEFCLTELFPDVYESPEATSLLEQLRPDSLDDVVSLHHLPVEGNRNSLIQDAHRELAMTNGIKLIDSPTR